MEGQKPSPPTPFLWRTVQGEPCTVAGRTLTPVARVISYGRGRGTLRQDSISGWATGFVRVKPLGMMVEADGQEEWVAVYNSTASALRRMVLAGAAITLLLAVMRRLARRCRQPATVFALPS